MPLTVTEAAMAGLKELLDNTQHAPGQVMRLMLDPQGMMSLVQDTEKEGDQVVKHQGVTVLVIERSISERLTGINLEVMETPQGRSLTLLRSSL